MATTLEELEKRVAELERRLIELSWRAVLHPVPTPAERAAESLRLGKAGQAEWVAGWEQFMERMGLSGLKPVSPEKLQEMMLAEGIKPEDNILSREIIAMREE